MKLVEKRVISLNNKKMDLRVANNHNYVVEGVVVHNSNCRLGYVLQDEEWHFVAGSKSLQRKDTGQSLYWFPFNKYPQIKSLLKYVFNTFDAKFSVILYGEIYGAGVQGGFNYGLTGLDFAAFDISVDGKYIDFAFDYCGDFDIPFVPILNDEFETEFSFARVVELSKGKSELGGDHIREGVVVKPFHERNEPNIGRVVLKYVSDDFLHKNVKEDTTDQ